MSAKKDEQKRQWLRRCPHCGDRAKLYTSRHPDSNRIEGFRVECLYCNGWHPTKEDAIKEWNQRSKD